MPPFYDESNKLQFSYVKCYDKKGLAIENSELTKDFLIVDERSDLALVKPALCEDVPCCPPSSTGYEIHLKWIENGKKADLFILKYGKTSKDIKSDRIQFEVNH